MGAGRDIDRHLANIKRRKSFGRVTTFREPVKVSDKQMKAATTRRLNRLQRRSVKRRQLINRVGLNPEKDLR